MMKRYRAQLRNESGSILLTVTAGMITVLAIAGLVLDLAAVRVNRSLSQTLADSAATAGALDADGSNGQAGCETAFAYLDINMPSGVPFSGADCLSLGTSCDGMSLPASTSGTSGSWVATVTYPVSDGSPLLQPSAVGRPSQALHTDDGDPCDRFAVSLQSTQQYMFGRLLGATSQTSEIHAVAKSIANSDNDVAINLLVLERYDCAALRSSGGATIVVDAVYDAVDDELDHGYVAVDSDGSGSCGGNGVMDVSGAGSAIRADGPAGCAGQTGTRIGDGGKLVGEGCGTIELLAPGTPGCNYPACTGNGIVAPDPSAMGARLTRAPVDHLYNCKPSYPMPVGWEIEGCSDTPAPHIDNLVAAYGGNGTPGGFTTWTGAGYPCNPNFDILVPAGNWHIDCPTFRPRETVAFTGGDVIIDGSITLNSDAVLAVNVTGLAAPFSPASDEAILFLRDGVLNKGGQASLIIRNTTVYATDDYEISMTGGSGTLVWTSSVAGDFDGLALWAESDDEAKLAGSSGLVLRGTFFAPWAEIAYSGNGSQDQAEAQFIARRLSASGNGTLVVRPNYSRAVKWPPVPESRLIR